MTEPLAKDLAGSTVAGKYRVERLLGQGGMGSVWAGRHLTLGKLVAVKFIHEKLAGSPDALRRFDTEAKAAAKIKSRHAVEVFDHGVTESGQPYIVMEYLEGESLESALRSRGKLRLKEVITIVTQAARALQAAHDARIVHRDLKPDNVFLARDADAGQLGYTVKLVDFGIAKIVQDEAATGAAATQAGLVLGTPHYMSPEALTASTAVSAASDVWSLGACAFAAACGRVPFEGDAIGDVVLKVCAAPLPVPSKIEASLPAAFDDWFAKACARDPKRRFQTAGAAADALQRLEEWGQAQRDHTAYEIRPLQPSSLDISLDDMPAPGKAKMLAGVLVGASLMLGALGFYVYRRTKEVDAVMQATQASAAAVVEAENQRKLKEAEKYFWAGVPDAGVDAGDAGEDAARAGARGPKAQRKKPKSAK
jgi:eukaryotic-like serine/threonine-protein kinase